MYLISSVILIVFYISFELTPLYIDGAKCTHLTLLASHSLQLNDLVHFPAHDET
jgi:hypothetical protein